MIQKQLADLKGFILQYNDYFNNAFDDVVQDETTGIVHNGKPVFPADNLGDYFYLRLPRNWGFDYNSAYTVAQAINGVGLRAEVVLVAFVKDASADALFANLLNTLRAYKGADLRLTAATAQKEVVLMQELAKVDEEDDQIAALQRLPDNAALISITFTLTVPADFQHPKCNTFPCPTC